MHVRVVEHLNLECSRRRTLCSAIGIAASALMWPVRSVGAIRGWCKSDPLILINGVLADITYDAPLDALLKVTGPTQVVVTVPHGVNAKLVLAGPGFGRGERVSFINPGQALDVEGQAAYGEYGDPAGSEQQKGKKKKRGKDKRSRKNKGRASSKKSNAGSEFLKKRTSVDVNVAVFVPAVEDMPVGVDFAPHLLRLLNPIRAEGTTNSWITLSAKV